MTSCARLPKVVIVPSERAVTIVKAGQTVTAANDGVLVSMGLWVEMNELLMREQDKNDQK